MYASAYMYVCIPRGCLVLRGQKRVSDALKLDLQVVIDYLFSSGATSTLNHWAICLSGANVNILKHTTQGSHICAVVETSMLSSDRGGGRRGFQP